MRLSWLERGKGPLVLTSLSIPADVRVLVTAPHPDDFDAIGITMKLFRDNGNPVAVVVLTSGAGGVEDDFAETSDNAGKARIRLNEQRASCRFFGLPETDLSFLDLNEYALGDSERREDTGKSLHRMVKRVNPDLIFLPHGNDRNATHRATFALIRDIARAYAKPVALLLNRDPKTIQMRYDALTPFGDEQALWKGELLRFHASQHQRNLKNRGHGFDERILKDNRETARRAAIECPFAEGFEIQVYGGSINRQ